MVTLPKRAPLQPVANRKSEWSESHDHLKTALESSPNCEAVENIESLLPRTLTVRDTVETLNPE